MFGLKYDVNFLHVVYASKINSYIVCSLENKSIIYSPPPSLMVTVPAPLCLQIEHCPLLYVFEC